MDKQKMYMIGGAVLALVVLGGLALTFSGGGPIENTGTLDNRKTVESKVQNGDNNISLGNVGGNIGQIGDRSSNASSSSTSQEGD